VFWLELPLKIGSKAIDTNSLTPSALNVPQEQPKQAHVLNVLVVDDVQMNRDIAGSFLRAAGHSPTYAESGEEAVVLASTSNFDVVLMDVRMPGMGGLEATRRIRSLGGVRGQVPIVAVTAHAFAEQVEECRKAGMDGHVAKPFNPTMLLSPHPHRWLLTMPLTKWDCLY
jgi:CheY-like chemotaxis protein